MRIHISGECAAAKAVRGYLRRHDFHVTAHAPDWVIHMEESAAAGPAVDGVGGELEQAILKHVRKQTASAIELRTAQTGMSDREVRILIPALEAERKAIETGVFRAVLEVAKQGTRGGPSRFGWWKTILKGKSK